MISVKGNLTGKLNTTYTKIYPELENLTVTPSEEQQKFIHEDRYGYDKVVVNPIPDKYIIPSGALDITENGNYNVKEKEFAKVNVPTKTFGTKTITTNGTYLATDDGIDGYSKVEVATSGVDINDYFKSETIEINPTSVGCWYKFVKKIPKLNLNITNNCASMFYYCKAEEIDVSEFNTKNVTNMYQMFYNCSSLTSLDVSSFDTSKVKSMSNMFNGCSKLTSLDLSNFNTSNVTNMQNMFGRCYLLTELDLSNFDTSSVTNMSAMFYTCINLNNLNISNFDFSKVTSYSNMFQSVPANCYILVKDATAKEWITSKFTNLTNVHYVGEIE